MNKKSIIAISIITIMIMAGFTGLVYYNNPQIVNSNKTNISTEEALIMSEKGLKVNNVSMNCNNTHAFGSAISITTFLFNGKVSDRYFLINTTRGGKPINVLFLTIDSENTTHYTIYTLSVDVLYSKTGLSSFTTTAKVNHTLLSSNNSEIQNSAVVQSVSPKPAISGSAGMIGWAVSFSPSNMKGLAYQLYDVSSAGTYAAIVGFIVQSGIEGSIAGPLGTVAGVIASIIIGIGFWYLYQYDMSHGNPGVWFGFTWGGITPDGWGLNPVPWYF